MVGDGMCDFKWKYDQGLMGEIRLIERQFQFYTVVYLRVVSGIFILIKYFVTEPYG